MMRIFAAAFLSAFQDPWVILSAAIAYMALAVALAAQDRFALVPVCVAYSILSTCAWLIRIHEDRS